MKFPMIRRSLVAAATVSLLLSAGCTVTGGGAVVTDREPDYREPGTQEMTPRPPPQEDAPYANLLERAAQARSAGDYEEALSLLERAQRIDPASADIYLELAQTHHYRGDDAQARATAERGLLYCRDEIQCAALRRYTQ